ncbi:MAG: hypothetical protein ABJ370_21630 [Paracoccaceae bacterium]
MIRPPITLEGGFFFDASQHPLRMFVQQSDGPEFGTFIIDIKAHDLLFATASAKAGTRGS